SPGRLQRDCGTRRGPLISYREGRFSSVCVIGTSGSLSPDEGRGEGPANAPGGHGGVQEQQPQRSSEPPGVEVPRGPGSSRVGPSGPHPNPGTHGTDRSIPMPDHRIILICGLAALISGPAARAGAGPRAGDEPGEVRIDKEAVRQLLAPARQVS